MYLCVYIIVFISIGTFYKCRYFLMQRFFTSFFFSFVLFSSSTFFFLCTFLHFPIFLFCVVSLIPKTKTIVLVCMCVQMPPSAESVLPKPCISLIYYCRYDSKIARMVFSVCVYKIGMSILCMGLWYVCVCMEATIYRKL